jgi:hypothetical protein
VEKANIYIKKILFLLICVVTGYFLSGYLALYYILPVLLLAFSLADFKITGRKPEYLFNFRRTEEYFKKGGLRDLLRIIVSLLAFVYDAVVWVIWGVYLIFELLTEFLFLLRNIFFWIIYGILWFLKLFVPPIVIIFKLIIHYLIKWIWWIYSISFKNISSSLRKDHYFAALKGTVLSIFIVFVFYFIGILVEVNGIVFIGVVLALLPVTWIFGQISLSISKTHQDKNEIQALSNYNNGLESVRSVLFYITVILLLFIVQILLNLLGWIPDAGFSLLGVALNINTFITLVLIFLTVITIFGVMIIPTHRLFNVFREVSLRDSVSLLGIIFRKGLQYILLLVPSSFFSVFLIIIPAVIIAASLWFAIYIKDNVIDAKIGSLKNAKIEAANEIEDYMIQTRIENLRLYKDYPWNIYKEIKNRSNLDYEIKNKKEELTDEEAELNLIDNETTVEIEQIEAQINTELIRDANSALVADLRNQKIILEKNLAEIKAVKGAIIGKLIIDISNLENYKLQLFIAFFLAGVWISIFGGMILAFVFAYIGNAFYEIYLFRNDNKPSYWRQISMEEKEKDGKQPLIGFTLLAIVVVIVLVYFYFIRPGYSNNYFF